jgi:hypothetical protein
MESSSTSGTPTFCASCGAPLSPGARFCHRCGTAAGSAGPGPLGQSAPLTASVLPWGVAAIALIALIALLAGQFFGGRTPPPSAAQAPAAPAAPFAGGGAGPAPDISAMSPQERADRLFFRVMDYSTRGLADSATFFAPMALGALEAIEPRTAHHRYDMGLIGLVTGDGALAAAQADSILADAPTHLLGLALAARVADARRDTVARNAFERRLLQAEASERAKQLPEYVDHENDLRLAIETARRPPAP